MTSWVELNTKSESDAGGMGGDFIINRGISEEKLLIGVAVVAVIFLILKFRKSGR